MCDMFAKDNKFIDLYKKLGISVITTSDDVPSFNFNFLDSDFLNNDEIKPDFIVEKKDDVR